MTDLFPAAMKIVLEDEGVFSNDAKDPGGATVYGIARTSHPTIPWPPTMGQAVELYRAEYWTAAGCDRLAWRWALPVFECAVNQGVQTAKGLLQEALGVLIDRKIGPETIAATERAGDDIVDLFMALRDESYVNDSGYQRFGKGWFRRAHKTSRLAALPAPIAAS